MMDYNVLLNKAIIHIEILPNGTTFKLKDLFIGYEWINIPKGDRLHLGKTFKRAVMNKTIESVEYLGKSSDNSAVYRKV